MVGGFFFLFFFFFLCRFLSFIGGTLYEIGKPEMQQKINSFLEKEGMEKTAESLQTTVHTLQVIVDGLSQPESFDFRTGKRWMGMPFTWVAQSDPAPQDPPFCLSLHEKTRAQGPSFKVTEASKYPELKLRPGLQTVPPRLISHHTRLNTSCMCCHVHGDIHFS